MRQKVRIAWISCCIYCPYAQIRDEPRSSMVFCCRSQKMVTDWDSIKAAQLIPGWCTLPIQVLELDDFEGAGNAKLA